MKCRKARIYHFGAKIVGTQVSFSFLGFAVLPRVSLGPRVTGDGPRTETVGRSEENVDVDQGDRSAVESDDNIKMISPAHYDDGKGATLR